MQPKIALMCAAAIATLATALSAMADAQSPDSGRMLGIVYDSLHHRPLTGALVTSDQGSVAITDSVGRFEFRNTSPSRNHRLVLSHAVLDSLGVAALAMDVRPRDVADTSRLSIPSFARLWRAACGDFPVPSDSALLIGTTRDAVTLRPIPRQVIHLSWTVVDGSIRRLSEAESRVATTSDTAGRFAACGVPTDVAIHVSATPEFGSTNNGTTIAPDSEHVRFLALAVLSASDSALVGVVRGTVRDSHGQAIPGAHVTFGDSLTVETDMRGAFRAARIPLGTHHMGVIAIGILPAGRTVEVHAGDSNVADITVSTVTALDAATILGTRSVRRMQFDDLRRRQQLGIGHFLDSTTVGSYLTITQAVSSVESTAHLCAVYIDGTEFEPGNWGELKTRNTRDIGVLETHRLSDPTLPSQFRSKWCRRSLSVIVIIWTRAALPP